MDITRLTRQSHRRDRAGPSLLGQFPLTGARAHEACGPARRRLALWLARAGAGTVLWVRAEWHPDRLHMAGLRDEIAPGRLLMVEARRPEDQLWTAEEAARAGCVPLIVVDIADLPGLTSVRRLHLAAETGAENNGMAPVVLLLTPGDGGAPGVETRWHLAPAHDARSDGWQLSRLRARTAPPAMWRVARGADGDLTVRPKRQSEPA